MILHTVSTDDPISRACRRAAADVLRLENVRAAAKLVAPRSRTKAAKALRVALDALDH